MSSDDASLRTGQEGNGYQKLTLQALMEQNPLLSNRSQLKFQEHTITKPDIFTLYFGFFGYHTWGRVVAAKSIGIMENHYTSVGRVPTQPEFDSMIEHTTRGIYHSQIGGSIGIFAGGAWAYQILRTLPRPSEDSKGPRILARISAMTSAPNFKSVAYTSTWRLATAWIFCGSISTFIGQLIQENNLSSDSRLERYFVEKNSQKEEDKRKRLVQLAHERARVYQNIEQERRHRSTQATGQQSGDINGGHGQDSDTSIAPPDSYSEYTSSETSQSSYSSPSTQTEAPVQATGPLWARGRQVQPTNEQSSGLDFFEDDASPTAPEYRHTNIDGSTGSAWDRIRRQNAGGRSPAPQQSAMPQSSQDPYSFAQNNQATQGDLYGSEQWSEKDQAQAEFDKMVDSERNAGRESSSWGRGWGS